MTDKAALPAPLLGTYALIALCGIVPLWVISATPTPATTGWIGVLIAAVIAGGRFAWVVASAQRRPYEMVVWLFFYLFLGVAPMVQLRAGLDPSTTPSISHAYDWTAAGLVIATEISLIIGSTFARSSPIIGSPRTIRPVSSRRAAWFATVMFVAAVGYIVAIGPSTLVTSRIRRNEIVAATFGDDVVGLVVGATVSLGLLVAVVALLQIARERRRSGALSLARIMWVVLGVILLFAIVNPISSPRYLVGVVALGVFAALGAYARTTNFRLVSIVTLLGLVVIFPALDAFRYDEGSDVSFEAPLTALAAADFDGFAQIVNTVQYVTEHGLTWGGQFLGVVLFWVPRAVWPGKPVDTGILLADYRGYAFSNLSAPLPAELFINFGWFAVIIGGLLLGFALRKWDAANEDHLRARGVPTVLGCVVPFYMLLLLRGSLLQAASNLAVLLLAWFLVTRTSGELKMSSMSRASSRSRRPTRGLERMTQR